MMPAFIKQVTLAKKRLITQILSGRISVFRPFLYENNEITKKGGG